MAAGLQRLLKKSAFSSSLPLLRVLGTPQLPHTSPLSRLPLHEVSQGPARTSSSPLPPLPPDGEGAHLSTLRQPSLIFPNFPLAYLLDPVVPLPCSGESDRERGDGIDGRTVWADSVKKKRKRKMNKHKLRKLRRMLRRKT